MNAFMAPDIDRPRFDLLDEPWVPLEDRDGIIRFVGLLDAFEHASEWRRILDPSPLVTVALYRLLFAVFQRAVPLPTLNDWEDAWVDGTAHAHVPRYLRRWRNRFDLFGDATPFWQVPDMDERHGVMAWTKLLAELNDNNSKVLFDHTVTAVPPPATPAEVARALVACQAMSVGAGKSTTGYNVHAPIATALVVIPEGATLGDTLLANAQIMNGDQADLPVWERPPVPVETLVEWNTSSPPHVRIFDGPADRLTWRTRAIRIVPPEQGEGVRWIRFGAGERPANVDGDLDPWVAHRIGGDDVVRPQRLLPERAIWRDLHAIVTTHAERAMPARVVQQLHHLSDSDRPARAWTMLVAGQAADKAKVEAWGQERWRVPAPLLGGRLGADAHLGGAIKDAEATADRLRRRAYGLARDLRAAREPARADVTATASRLPTITTYWATLERHFAGLLDGLGSAASDADVDAALARWAGTVADAVDDAAETTHRLIGRDAIAVRAWARAVRDFEAISAALRQKAGRLTGGTP